MKICIVNMYAEYNISDAMFKKEAYKIGDDLGYPIRCFRDFAQSKGHEVHTLDVFGGTEIPDAVIFLDFPFDSTLLKHFKSLGKKTYLIGFEPPMIRPENYDKKNWGLFDKIFLMPKEYHDFKKVFPFSQAVNIPDKSHFQRIAGDIDLKTRFCCMFAGNKQSEHPTQMYSERRNALDWFEKNSPQMMDLYGPGWTGLYRTMYKGFATDKRRAMLPYRYTICYENARGVTGYVTEKVFDAMLAGCIPIYWGDDELPGILPKDCIIDRRKYKNYELLYNYMLTLSKQDVKDRILAMGDWFETISARKRFSGDSFAGAIYKGVVG